MSMPRAAMSVATSTWNRPSLNPASAAVRCAWLRLPWMRADFTAWRGGEWGGEPVGPVLRAREGEHAAGAGLLEQLDQQRGLQLPGHRIDGVRDADRRRGPALHLDGHPGGGA